MSCARATHVAPASSLLVGVLLVLAGIGGCERGTAAKPALMPQASAQSAPVQSTPPVQALKPWPVGLSEREALHHLRAHYHESAQAARTILASASSEPIRNEAEWLLRIYEHVEEHFDVALRDWYGPAAAAEPDPVLGELTAPNTIADVKEREHLFAAEVARNHERLVTLVRSSEYNAFAVRRELLREIRIDVETSQASQITAFQQAAHAR